MALPKLKYGENGLIPAIIQDVDTGEVLTLFYMNEEAVQLTHDNKEVWRYSRSNQRLMRKGDTSGNVLHVTEMIFDCDEDALVVKVHADGPACHTGQRSCFYRSLTKSSAEPT